MRPHAVLLFAFACAPGQKPPESIVAPIEQPEPTPEPEPAETVVEVPPPKLATSDGPPMQLAYRGCLGDLHVDEIAGETFVLYGQGATGRIDRLGPDGTPTKTYDLPIGAAELRYASPKGPAPGAKVPIGSLEDLAGPTLDDLYVVGEFYQAMESWGFEVYKLRKNGKWVTTNVPVDTLHLRGDAAVLGYNHDGYFWPVAGETGDPSVAAILEHAYNAGAGVDTLDDMFSSGIRVVDYDVARHGVILAIVTYHDEKRGTKAKPVGTWLMAWNETGNLHSITRITEAFLEFASVVVDGDEGYVLFGNPTEFHHWHDGKLEPVALPEFAVDEPPGRCLRLLGVDPEHRLWIACNQQLAYRDQTGWHVETLPEAQWYDYAGLGHGVLWVLFYDGGLWSRGEDGTWTRTPWVEERPQRDDLWDYTFNTLHVGSDGSAWLVRRFVHDSEFGVGNKLQSTSYVYTTRPIPQPNRCR